MPSNLLIDHLERQRDDALQTAADVLSESGGDPSVSDSIKVDALLEDAERADNRLQQFRTRIRVTAEPLTYERAPECRQSFVRDLVLDAQHEPRATARLQRHAQEMHVELRARHRRTELEQRRLENDLGARFESRVNPNTTPGQGGNFAPPLWAIEEFATAPRPERVLAGLIPGFPLASGVSSVNRPGSPRVLLRTPTRIPAPSPTATSPTQAVTSSTVTIAGMEDVSIQLLEQSPVGAHLDWAFFKDLSADYDRQLETQLFNGTGNNSGPQLWGVQGLPSTTPTTNVTYTTVSPTVIGLWTYLGELWGQVADARHAQPEAWFVRGGRWAWLASGEDTSNRPISTP